MTADEVLLAVKAALQELRAEFAASQAAALARVDALDARLTDTDASTQRALDALTAAAAQQTEHALARDVLVHDQMDVLRADLGAQVQRAAEQADQAHCKIDQLVELTPQQIDSMRTQFEERLALIQIATKNEAVVTQNALVAVQQKLSTAATSAHVSNVESVVVEWCTRLEDRAAVQDAKLAGLESDRLRDEATLDMLNARVAEMPRIEEAWANNQARLENAVTTLQADVVRLDDVVASARNDLDAKAAALRSGVAALEEVAAQTQVDVKALDLNVLAMDAQNNVRFDALERKLADDITEVTSALTAATDAEGETRARVAALDQRVEDHVMQIVHKVSTLAENADAHVEVARAEFKNLLESRVSQDTFDTLRSDMAAALSVREIATQAVTQRLDALQADVLERYTLAESWARGGEPYKRAALVRHKGGVWQATEVTTSEPGTDDAWFLLANGVAGVEVQSLDDAQARFAVRLSDGTDVGWSFRAPVPRFRGVYNPEETYLPWDTVAKDGRVFLALVKDPGAPSETLGEWQVFTGPPGKKGLPGDPAPSMAQIVEQARAPLVDAVLEQVVPLLQEALNQR